MRPDDRNLTPPTSADQNTPPEPHIAGAGGSRVKLRRHGTPSEFPIAPCCASSLALPIFGHMFKQLEYQEATLFLIGWCNPGSFILFGLLDQIFQKTSRQHR